MHIGHTISDYSRSGLVRIGAFSIGVLSLGSLPLAALSIAYTLWDRKKIVHELAVLFFNLWYGLPDFKNYEQIQEGKWLFYQQKDVRRLFHFDFTAGSYFLDPIAQYGNAKIFLGALPQKHHAKWLSQQGCQVVISMVEDREYDVPYCIGNQVKPEQWKELGMQIYRFSTPDYHSLSEEVSKKATMTAIEALQKGKSVYIHCKAGMGRSALVVANVLRQMGKRSIDDALQLIKKARPQISPNSEQIAGLIATT